jgi:hypothetical protein
LFGFRLSHLVTFVAVVFMNHGILTLFVVR